MRIGLAPAGVRPHRSRALIIPLEQSLAVHAWIAEGVDRAAEELADCHAFDSEITVLETRCWPLAELGSLGFEGGEELIAGVLCAVRGRLSGAGLLSMEPEDALAWVLADGPAADALARYVELGGRVLAAVARAAASALQVEVEVGAARLEEASVAGSLVRTHAPSDTVVVGSRLELRAGGQRFAAQLHLVMEPKVVSALLGALAVSLH